MSQLRGVPIIDAPVPQAAFLDANLMLDKLSAFYLAKSVPAGEECGGTSDRYFPAVPYGSEPDDGGIYPWRVFDALECRFLADEEVLGLSGEQLMKAKRCQ